MQYETMELQYLNLMREILEKGQERDDRTGTGTFGVFGRQLRCDLQHEFPILTTKKIFFRGVIEELLWMLRGETSVRPLQEKNVRIWDEWADARSGELGPIYGKQWRNFEGKSGSVDQIQLLIYNLIKDPYSRRHVVSAWHPVDLPKMALAPCHCLFQFFVGNDDRLSCQLYQRSADLFLGVPFNMASYAALTMLVAKIVGRKPGEFIHTFGDVHIYRNHVNQCEQQLTRQPSDILPALLIRDKKPRGQNDGLYMPWEYDFEDFVLLRYYPQDKIEADVAV